MPDDYVTLDGPTSKRAVHPNVDALNKLTNERLLPRRQYALAAIAMRRALEIEPTSAELWANLSSHLWCLKRYDEALDAAIQAIRFDPIPSARLNLALIMEALGDFLAAEHILCDLLGKHPHHHAARWNLSLLQLGRGNYVGGFRNYDSRIDYKAGSFYPTFEAPRWQGEPLEGKTIYVSPEQGLGDTILFSRYLTRLIEHQDPDEVFVSFPAQMASLLWDVAFRLTMLPEGVPVPKTDYMTYLGSLPQFFETPTPEPGCIRSRCREQLRVMPITIPEPPQDNPKPLKIGICWSGNPNQDKNLERSIPLDMLMELAEDPRVWLYSLQCGPAAQDIARIGAGPLLLDMSNEMQLLGLAGTGSAILQLDLVITVCTSIAHLSGSLGAKTWVLLCDTPYWVWGYGDAETTPWYPSARLFRQTKPGDWRGVIDRVKTALANFTGE